MKKIAFVIGGAARIGRKALNKKNKAKAEACAEKILHLRAELFAEPNRYRGESVLKNVSKGGKEKAAQNKVKHADWQRLADEYWQKRPKASAREVARSIARETGDNFNTIRNVIKKNKNTAEV